MSGQALYGLPVPAGQSWEELLSEAVRPEFAVAVYLADPDDAVRLDGLSVAVVQDSRYTAASDQRRR